MRDKYFWYCNVCGAQNSYVDGECQYCECGGADCKRDNCADERHVYASAGPDVQEEG